MANFTDPITGLTRPVSPRSAQVVVMALVAAHRYGTITDQQYQMAYAEICEPGRLPQLFGGGAVDKDSMVTWMDTKLNRED